MIAMACTDVIVDRYSNQPKFSDIYNVFNYYTQYPFARFLVSVFQFQININLLPCFVRIYQVQLRNKCLTLHQSVTADHRSGAHELLSCARVEVR
jgi:hypothetical protein